MQKVDLSLLSDDELEDEIDRMTRELDERRGAWLRGIHFRKPLVKV